MVKPSQVLTVLFGASSVIFGINYFKEKNINNKLNTQLTNNTNQHLDFRYKIITIKDAYKDTAVEAQLEKALDDDLTHFSFAAGRR